MCLWMFSESDNPICNNHVSYFKGRSGYLFSFFIYLLFIIFLFEIIKRRVLHTIIMFFNKKKNVIAVPFKLLMLVIYFLLIKL